MKMRVFALSLLVAGAFASAAQAAGNCTYTGKLVEWAYLCTNSRGENEWCQKNKSPERSRALRNTRFDAANDALVAQVTQLMKARGYTLVDDESKASLNFVLRAEGMARSWDAYGPAILLLGLKDKKDGSVFSRLEVPPYEENRDVVGETHASCTKPYAGAGLDIFLFSLATSSCYSHKAEDTISPARARQVANASLRRLIGKVPQCRDDKKVSALEPEGGELGSPPREESGEMIGAPAV